LITFLIVEDCTIKLAEIRSKLSRLGINEARIKDVNNKIEALELLAQKPFDFLILDINIYQDKGSSTITKGSGIDLLIDLEDSLLSPRNSYNIPNTIFVMSEDPEAITNNGQAFNRCKVVPCQYVNGSQDWSSELEVELKRAELRQQSVIEKKSNELVVYSVHGIQTFGGWQEKLDTVLKKYGEGTVSEHIIYKYHHFPITHFLRSSKRADEVDKLSKDLLILARRFPEARICIVGHSFGTYLIAESLKKISDRLNIDRIILAGSVLQSDYDWTDIINKHNIKSVTNECASKDSALVFSHFFAKGLGMAGIEGLSPHGGIIINRHFEGGHSCFFTDSTFSQWSQYIHGDILDAKDDRGDAQISDMLFSFLTKTRRRWVFLTFFGLIFAVLFLLL